MRCLVTRTYEPPGVFAVRFCKNGEWTNVVVDDQLPCDAASNTLLFARSDGRVLWPSIFEKAYARLHGSYGSIEGVAMYESMTELTGAPCEIISCLDDPFDSDLQWVRLVSFRDAKYIMGAACSPSSEAEASAFKAKGLIANHGYSILDLSDIHGHRLIKFRNPWGRVQWTGDWSKNSKNWTPELKSALLPHLESDGVFWMSYGDVLKYFPEIYVCKVNLEATECKFKGAFPTGVCLENDFKTLTPGCCYEVDTFEPSTILITISQSSFLGIADRRSALFGIGIIVLDVLDPENPQLVAFTPPSRRTCVELEFLTASDCKKYLVLPISFHPAKMDSTFVLTLSCMKPIVANQRDVSRFSYSQFVRILAQVVRQTCKPQLMSRPGDDSVMLYTGLLKDTYISMVENRSSHLAFSIDFNCSKSVGMSSLRSGRKMTKDHVPPRSLQILNVLQHVWDGSFSYGYEASYKPEEWRREARARIEPGIFAPVMLLE